VAEEPASTGSAAVRQLIHGHVEALGQRQKSNGGQHMVNRGLPLDLSKRARPTYGHLIDDSRQCTLDTEKFYMNTHQCHLPTGRPSGDVANAVQGSGFIRHARHLATAVITEGDEVIAEAFADASAPLLIVAAQVPIL
jgi:hypothetical protein